jgi:Skp family chaperone for outer membrane proteins
MRTTMKKMTCRALVVSMLAFSFSAAQAGMIGADRAAPASADRAAVISVLDRAETAAQLQAQGIDPTLARERVAAMSDQEVQQLAQTMQTAPAGASLSAGGWLAIVVVAGLVWYYAMRK